jgi:trans-aconitate 2-methyltransferase
LEREVEPELMDDPAQAQAYAAADFSAGDVAFTTFALTRLSLGRVARVVDLGCGPGNITLRVAAARPGWAVEGWDGAESMLALARAAGARQPNAHFLLRCLPVGGEGPFDGAVCNSLLHHLHRPEALWDTLRAVVPGAVAIVGDLRRPPNEAAAAALLEAHAASAPPVLRADFAASLRAAFTVAEVTAQLEASGFARWRVEPVGDRHLRAWGRVPGP